MLGPEISLYWQGRGIQSREVQGRKNIRPQIGGSGEAAPPEPLQINKATSSWPSWPSSLSSSPPSSPSWLSSPWHPHGFELTSTSRGMLGDGPVGSLDFNPSRFVEICRLFFSIVDASRHHRCIFLWTAARVFRVNGKQSLSLCFRPRRRLRHNAFHLFIGTALFINSQPRWALSGAGQIPLSAHLQGCDQLRGRRIPDDPDREWVDVLDGE